MKHPTIAVLGSLNLDFTLQVPRIPRAGETLTSVGSYVQFGGKGGNQAIAAARAGGKVFMIGCLGKEDHGRSYLEHLRAEGIDTCGVLSAEETTGSAWILVDERGENLIVVTPGANRLLGESQVEANAEQIRASDALLVQLESPIEAVRRASQIAREAGVQVILNPSPCPQGGRKLGLFADVWIVNEHEAEQVSGLPFGLLVENRAAVLKELQASVLVVTRGSASTIVLHSDGRVFEAIPPKITPVDTVGAGDSFSGMLAVCLSRGMSFGDAVDRANTAGALATLRFGAQASIPCAAEVDDWIRGR